MRRQGRHRVATDRGCIVVQRRHEFVHGRSAEALSATWRGLRKQAGAAPEGTAPAVRNLNTSVGLGRPVLLFTPDPLRADEVDGRESLGRQPTRVIATTARKSRLLHRLRRADWQRADPDAPGLQNHNGTAFDTWRYFAQIGEQQIDLPNRTAGCRSTEKND